MLVRMIVIFKRWVVLVIHTYCLPEFRSDATTSEARGQNQAARALW